MAATERDVDTAKASPLAKRQRAMLIIAVAAAVTSTGGLVASTVVKSPAQLAADTRPPNASVLTAKVVHKVLSTTLIMRGTFTAGRQYKFTPTSVAASSHGDGAADLVVTAVHAHAGTQVRAGEVLLEVSERPVYALQGAFPAYRDLVPGQIGKDVAQLQAGLGRLGYPSSDERGHFGASTKAAVRRFYRHIGYPVPLTAGAADKNAQNTNADANSAPSRSATPRRTSSGPSDTSSRTAPEPMVPKSEVAFLPALPARLASISAHLGGTVPNPAITFTTGGLTLTGKLPPGDVSLVKVGMKAQVTSEATGFEGTGTIGSIGRRTGASGASGGENTFIPLRINSGTSWPRELQGEDVRVTITTASTKKAVLAVPEAAISSAADGRTTIIVMDNDRTQHAVEVRAGISADGMVEVSPRGATLEPGDLVVTGR
jgi:hypothetical protein